jgi:hypothetical protein
MDGFDCAEHPQSIGGQEPGRSVHAVFGLRAFANSASFPVCMIRARSFILERKSRLFREVLLEYLFYLSLAVLTFRAPIHKSSMLREMNTVVNGSIVHRRNISYGRTSD